ncbi:MAG TPA: hypothetical protein PLP19_05315 [bacterium]|nr:hypothetical protein [bacterium]HPN42890.1 hypothetical protein [bacterium]
MKRYLEQTVDFLGFLGAKLRDLKGYATLTNEILQNADDAPDVTSVSFDINEMAMFVENNGSFRELDFDRMRKIAAGAKSTELNTIGVFGIGFLSAYQITDNPIIVSSGRKWTFYPEADEGQRIVEIDCNDYGKTYFGFPWARNPHSNVRTKLKLEHITEKSIENLKQELLHTLPTSILFLRKINNIVVKENGQVIQTIIKKPLQDNKQVLLVNNKEIVWYLIKTDFNHTAAELRNKYPYQIEEKREADVAIAIPGDMSNFHGHFYAYLPIPQITSLPFHINADFFTSSDRKRVIFENDYQAIWNETAIIEVARSLIGNLTSIAEFLGPKEFWEFLERIRDAHQQVIEGHNVPVVKKIWDILQMNLAQARIVYSNSGEWLLPRETFLLEDKVEYEIAYILEALGLKLVHPDLFDKQKLMRHESINIPRFGALELARALHLQGFGNPRDLVEAPEWFLDDEGRKKLGAEIERLLNRERIEILPSIKSEIQNCCIAISVVNKLNAPKSLWAADKEEVDVFSALNLAYVFAANNNPAGISQLINEFDVPAAIDIINLGIRDIFEPSDENHLEAHWKSHPQSIIGLIEWFDQKRKIIKGDEELIARLRKLPIWPSGEKLYTIEQLFIPGNFEDPLNITSLVDKYILNNYRDLLTILGIQELNIINYVKMFVPRCFQDKNRLSREKIRELVQFLSRNLGTFIGNDQVKTIYQQLEIIECYDGKIRKPQDVYFYDREREKIFGSNIAFVAPMIEKQKSLFEFYKWLGISYQLRSQDILSRIREVIKQPPDEQNRHIIQHIFAIVGSIWKELDDKDKEDYYVLKKEKWLPAENDFVQWHSVDELYTTFNAALFKSTALFLDIDKQKSYSGFIHYLEIPTTPDCDKVVLHLLNCIKSNEKVTPLVYRFLNKYVNDPAIDLLQGKPFIFVEGKGYLPAQKVFLGKHDFGKYRVQLESYWYHYADLLLKLNVREDPTDQDIIDVIIEINQQYQDGNKPLPETGLQVLNHCYQLLNDKPVNVLSHLSQKKIIPNTNNILTEPVNLFFNDQSGLAQKFDKKLRSSFIPINPATWRAMNSTGVQLLHNAAEYKLVDSEQSTVDRELMTRITQRKNLIFSLFKSIIVHPINKDILSFIDQLLVYKMRSLKIEFSLNINNDVVKNTSEAIAAYLDRKNYVLYYQEVNNKTPWLAISREIASQIDPFVQAGLVAAGIKEILSADTMEEAEAILADLGIVNDSHDHIARPAATHSPQFRVNA